MIKWVIFIIVSGIPYYWDGQIMTVRKDKAVCYETYSAAEDVIKDWKRYDGSSVVDLCRICKLGQEEYIAMKDKGNE